jgi:hypothetical protein
VFRDWIPPIPLQTATGIEMFTVRWTFRLDPLSAMMAVLVKGSPVWFFVSGSLVHAIGLRLE